MSTLSDDELRAHGAASAVARVALVREPPARLRGAALGRAAVDAARHASHGLLRRCGGDVGRPLPDRAGGALQSLRLLPVARTLSRAAGCAIATTDTPSPISTPCRAFCSRAAFRRPQLSPLLEATSATSTSTTGDGADAARRAARARRRQGRAGLHADRRRSIADVHRRGADGSKVVANVAVGYNNIDVAGAQVARHRRDQHAGRAHRGGGRLHLGADPRDHPAARRRRSAGPARRLEGLGVRLHARHPSCAASSSGIIGVGRIGRAVAAQAPAFGMRVAYTPRAPSEPSRRRGDVARSAAGHLRRRLAARAADAGQRGT